MESLMLFKDINWKSFGIVVAIMAGIAIFFAMLIIIISRFCEVKGDPRVPEIVSHLSGANCGGCGHPGCEGFARARWLKARQVLTIAVRQQRPTK